MIITFCGHSQLFNSDDLDNKILEIIKKETNDKPVTFYLGGYGNFDAIAHQSAKDYKKEHPESEIIFVTPYLDETYLKNREPLKYGYDKIVYPDIENTPKRYAILERNKWMVKECDLVIAFVKYSWGGAYQTLKYAKQQKKKTINLGIK